LSARVKEIPPRMASNDFPQSQTRGAEASDA
jgi:hypothetical protein